ncbi:Rv2175c family DNA-binding protein [Rhodococcus aerolatus]
MSPVPAVDDVLDPSVPTLTLPAAGRVLGVAQSRVAQHVRDDDLLAVRRDRAVVVPAVFLDGTEKRVLKGLPGTIKVLLDGGWSRAEVLGWLFTPDESLPGTPVDALAGNRGKEITRRAQALAF